MKTALIFFRKKDKPFNGDYYSAIIDSFANGGITVDTVERYQGSQRDVIIYGFTVRQPYQLRFLCSQSFVEQGTVIDRKLNVALTRAREQLVLIGNPTILSLDEVHRRLIEEIGATTFPE